MANHPLRSTAARFALVTGLASLAALGALAGPELVAPAPDTADTAYGPYAIVCWQEGQKVFEERGLRDLASLELNEPLDANLTHADGSRRLLLSLGEALCILEYQAD